MKAIGFHIAPISQQTFPQALSLLKAGLGENYITTAGLKKYLPGTDNATFRTTFVAVDEETGKVLGAITGELVTPRSLRETFLTKYCEGRQLREVTTLRHSRTGLVKSVAVAPCVQGKGIGRALVKQMMETLQSHGATALYSLGWVSADNGCHIQRTLESLGFRPVKHFKHFYYEDSLQAGEEGYCPVCNTPCYCGVILFVNGSSFSKQF